ncbi:hypothetical protein [Methanoculleus chikugoensis]|uniref:DUF2206 domain-containing protein n=1 Tax=Methanoculleus chikugoensis TaxID=118126 RepID=UPI001FB307E6|nr:hypothetical protein [Methanoculleus chikugoensis]
MTGWIRAVRVAPPFMGGTAYQALSVFFVVFFLFNSGLLYQVMDDNPTSMALDTAGDKPVFNSREVQGGSMALLRGERAPGLRRRHTLVAPAGVQPGQPAVRSGKCVAAGTQLLPLLRHVQPRAGEHPDRDAGSGGHHGNVYGCRPVHPEPPPDLRQRRFRRLLPVKNRPGFP